MFNISFELFSEIGDFPFFFQVVNHVLLNIVCIKIRIYYFLTSSASHRS